MSLQVTAVSKYKPLALFSDGQVGEVVAWWSATRFRTTQHRRRPTNPVSCVVRHPNGEEFAVDLRRPKTATVH